MTYQEALTAWVAKREGRDIAAITNVFVDSMDEGGSCGNDTCWFEAEVELSFSYYGNPEKRTYYIKPGEFVSEVADLARAPEPPKAARSAQ